MDAIYETGAKLIATLNDKTGYKNFHPQLEREIPLFSKELEKHFSNPTAFHEIMSKVNIRWNNMLSDKTLNIMRKYNDQLMSYNTKKMEAQQKLIQLAMTMDDKTFDNSKQVDKLADELADMMSDDPMVLLNRKMRGTQIQKPTFKRPSKKSKYFKK